MSNSNLPPNVFTLRQSEFRAIPGSPWVYWFDDSIIRMFTANQSLSEIAFGKHGLSTCNNFRYIRFWWEVARNNINWNVNNVTQTESNEHIWFPLAKEKTGKKVSGWSDIDIFAVKPGEPPLIIQCKSFSGTEKSAKIVEKVISWFNNAVEFLKESDYKKWAPNESYKKIFVVDASVKKTEEELKKKNYI